MIRDALIVGINKYKYLKPLNAPAADAEETRKLLKQYGQFNVLTPLPVGLNEHKEANINKQGFVTTTMLQDAIARLFNPKGNNIPDMALLFFSGHGLRIEKGGITEGFLASSDTNPKIGTPGISLDWLRKLLCKSFVREQVILLDCCYSGEILNFKEDNPGLYGKNRVVRCFIAASREFEEAFEISGEHGLLSSALIEAVNNRVNGIVTNHYLIDFINEKFRGSIQKPIFYNSSDEIIIATVSVPVEEKEEKSVLPSTKCPYKGLRHFDNTDEDAEFFYGRTSLTDELIEQVRSRNFLAVVGPSGSGKSSVVRAGLLHQLKLSKHLSGTDEWRVMNIITPDEHPLDSLVEAFVDDSLGKKAWAMQFNRIKEKIGEGLDGFTGLINEQEGNSRVVLVIDQFEEIFTLCNDKKERQRFFELILGALPIVQHKLCLIIAMRADFFSKCTEEEYAGLSRYIQDNLITVTPMTQEELNQVITEPAKKVGLDIEPSLVTQMIDDVYGSPGSLPLLQYALTLQWEKCDDHTFKLSTYELIGKVAGALSKHADEVYKGLSQEEQDIAKRIFIELTQLGEGTEDTRRRVSKDTLISQKHPEEQITIVIQKLTQDNLIVTDELMSKGGKGEAKLERIAVVDVAHEALIRNWQQLRKWIDDSRDDIRFKRRLDEAAYDWNKEKRSEGLLWRSPYLERLKEFYGKYKDEMNDVEVAFYKGSVEAKERAEREKEEKVRVQRRANIVLAALFLLTTVAAFFIYQYAERAKEGQKKVQSLLAEKYWNFSVSSKDDRKLLKSIHYLALSGKEEIKPYLIKNSIFNIQNHGNIFLTKLIQHDDFVLRGVWYKDNPLILTSNIDKSTIRLWNTKDDSWYTSPMKHDAPIKGIQFSKDKTYILTWSDSTIKLWNIKDSSVIADVKLNSVILGGKCNHDASIIIIWSDDKTVRMLNTQDGTFIGKPLKHDHDVSGVELSKDKARILIWGDTKVYLWNAIEGSIVADMKHEAPVQWALFNKDETLILTLAQSKRVEWYLRASEGETAISEIANKLKEVTDIISDLKYEILGREKLKLRREKYMREIEKLRREKLKMDDKLFESLKKCESKNKSFTNRFASFFNYIIKVAHMCFKVKIWYYVYPLMLNLPINQTVKDRS